jgi:hypothetical protein
MVDNMAEQPAAKLPRQATNFRLCLICQQETPEVLINSPSSHNKLLHDIRERATYGDKHYPEVNRRIGDTSEESLLSEGATWHRSCYLDTCNVTMCRRAKLRYEKQLTQKVQSQSAPVPLPSAVTFTRSQSIPYDTTVCFFCDTKSSKRNPLFMVRTDVAGRHLRSAIEKSNDNNYRVKLSTAISPNDAHAIDIQYHNKCWTTHVTNVLRKQSQERSIPNAANEIAADIEFVSLVEETLIAGEILKMSDLHTAYVDIRSANCAENPVCSRKKVKDLLASEIPGIEFHNPKRRNESDLVSVKESRDVAVQITAESQNRNIEADMKTLFEASIILRQVITKAERWTFSGSLTDITDAHVPTELYTLFRWMLQGTKSSLASDMSEGKRAAVDKHAKSLAQSTVYYHLSDRQTRHTSDVVRYHNEMPQQLGIGVAVRQAIRDKQIINILHGFGVSVAYERLLKLETQIANTVLQNMQENDGVYISANIVPGRHIFFAVDNVDFAEDSRGMTCQEGYCSTFNYPTGFVHTLCRSFLHRFAPCMC